MSNHAFVTSYKHFNGDQIEKDIQEILIRRFNNKIGYTRKNNYFEIGFGDEPKHPWSFTMWIASRRKLEFRHPNGDWNHWIFSVVQDELACKYGGMISDEGVGGRWRGEQYRHPTFRSFLDEAYKNLPGMLRYALQHIHMPKGWKEG